MAVITVDEDRVRELAAELAREPKSWDDCVWLFAETELRLRPALVGGALYQQGVEARQVELAPDLVVDQPAEGDIHALAEEIARLGPSLQDLHWYIAERRFIYAQVKAAAG